MCGWSSHSLSEVINLFFPLPLLPFPKEVPYRMILERLLALTTCPCYFKTLSFNWPVSCLMVSHLWWSICRRWFCSISFLMFKFFIVILLLIPKIHWHTEKRRPLDAMVCLQQLFVLLLKLFLFWNILNWNLNWLASSWPPSFILFEYLFLFFILVVSFSTIISVLYLKDVASRFFTRLTLLCQLHHSILSAKL